MIIELAGLRIEIQNLYSYTEELCRNYLSDGAPELTVAVSTEDIAFEREKSARESLAEGRQVRDWSDDYLESLAVYRKIAEIMPEYNTVLFHGSCVAVDGMGYIFTAKSGTGKSTHTRLWRELFGDRAAMINDDKPLIRLEEQRAIVFGTPWDGKHRLSSNMSVPLKALCILQRSENNHVEPITKSEAYPMLLQQVYRPAAPAALAKTLTLTDKLAYTVPLYRLGCNMEPDAARVAYEAMKG